MKGLKIKEVLLEEIQASEVFRLEPEFHTARSFELKSSFLGEDIIDFVQYGTSKELNEEAEGFPILRLNEFDSAFISKPSKYCSKIDKDVFESLKLKQNDVLICRTNGNPNLVGKSAIVPKAYNYGYASYLFKIRPKTEKIKSSALVAYLNSTYGRLEIEKFSMASNQVNFSPAKFRQMRIPHFSIELMAVIDKLTYEAYNLLEKSKELYISAEELLLENLKLSHFESSSDNYNIKSFKDSFVQTGRLDAEFYQPKYEQLLNVVRLGSYKKLKELVSIKKSIEPGSINYSDMGLPFLRVSDFTKFGITKTNKFLKHSFIKENKEKISQLKPKTGTILFSKDGSVGTAYHLRYDYEGITSGAVLHLEVKDKNKILPEYLTLVLNSDVVQMQAERDAGGSIILHWKVSEIKDVIIPILDFSIQENISAWVEESFAHKIKSEKLLDCAQRVVEIAIEKSEKEALNYIQSITIENEMSIEK